jgi:hypothetical protein
MGLVTIFARPLLSLAGLRPVLARRWALTAGLAVGILAALAFAASPAGAIVTPIGGGVSVGLQPRDGTTLVDGGTEPENFSNDSGNVVLHGDTSEYAIYWDPNDPTEFTHEWLANLDGFFQGLGEAGLDTPFGVLAQYRDRSNAVARFYALFKGAYSDTVKFPAGKCTDPKNPATTCLTDAQLREQLQSFIATHGLPKGMSTVYYLLTPPRVTVCLDAGKATGHCSDYAEADPESYEHSFCSYHSDINLDSALEGDGNTVLYAAIPWTAYRTAFDCQDGGWNPEHREEEREARKELTPKEEEALEKQLEEDPPKKRAEAEETIRLEGPHIEEPNQEGKSESGGYTAGLSDLLINQIAEEEINTVTDPLLGSWQDNKGEEATDLCRNFFASTAGEEDSDGEIAGSATANLLTGAGTLSNVTVGPGRYYINNVFSLSEKACSGGLGLIARFTAPNPVNAGEIVGVDGMESTVSLIETDAFGASGPPATTYAKFSWNFGDGSAEVTGYAPGAPICEAPWSSPCAASAFHSYQYGGTYTVTLKIIDVDGNKTSVSHEVTVVGPPAPGSPGASGSAGSSGSAGQAAPGSAAGAAAGVPDPIALATILRQSLHAALHKGLAVRYSVNEQVAGHFEVLLSRTLAHRLGITGSAPANMPAGSSELVIAKSVLVTTKGGGSALHIQFSKRTAARLARLHRVALTLRLIVRNAAVAGSSASTTVVTSATLGA